MIVRSTELQQRSTFNRFKKALFYTLASSERLVLNLFPTSAEGWGQGAGGGWSIKMQTYDKGEGVGSFNCELSHIAFF